MILVTGGNGQLATCLKDQVKEATFLNEHELDITKLDSTLNTIKELNPKYIVNCAAYTQVDNCEDEVELAQLVNVEGPKILAQICSELNIKLIHISTDYVFDGTSNTPYKETDQIKPLGVYGQTKAGGEKEVIESNCEYNIIRTSWLYSEYAGNFVKSISKLLGQRDELNIVYDQIGSPTYAQDLAIAIKKITETEFKKGIYHFSNLGVTSWFDLTKEVQSIKKLKCKVSPIESFEYPTKAKRPHYSVLDTRKIRDTYNIEIPYWKESLEKCLQKQF